VQAAELEEEVYPVLDELTTKISTLNLEHVRRLKSRLVALTRRVQKVSLVVAFIARYAVTAFEYQIQLWKVSSSHEINYMCVQVRDEIEQLMDDDSDMAEMYLTEKKEQQADFSFLIKSLGLI